jgi:ubiquinone/menaquinone biosynthesis C-methylase UbiE
MKADQLRHQQYYELAKQGSLDITHPALSLLKKELSTAKKIIDLGCGEGTRLSQLVGSSAIGVDINPLAINLAQKQYPKQKFIQADLSKLPFADNSFDLAYSAFVFEHLENPGQVINESQRVVKKGGKIIIIAPNFGVPNRASPNFSGNRFAKLFRGLSDDFKLLFRSQIKNLSWNKVTPKTFDYSIDADTTVEPDLITLKKFCQGLNLQPVFAGSFWSEDQFSLFQLPFRLLGTMGLYPFKYWGPHLCLILQNNKGEKS